MKVCKKGTHQYTPVRGSNNGCPGCKREYGAKKRKEHPEIQREYRAKHKERFRAYYKNYRKQNAVKLSDYTKERRAHYTAMAKKSRLKKHYGLSMEGYNKMFIEQGGCCAICGIPQSALKNSLCVDHNHTTKNIRGLLCDVCNRGLGYLKDSSSLLRKAAEYLDKEQSNVVPFTREGILS